MRRAIKISEVAKVEFRPKKSVALSGVTAGNTALCSVGKTGNDLHYRGYDIIDLAQKCEFEEVAYLLVHGKLPNLQELADYKRKLRSLRGLPESLKKVLEALPATAHPMDVLRTAVSALGAESPESLVHTDAEAREIADRLLASLGSMLLYWYQFANSGKRIEVQTDDDSIGEHFLHLLHGVKPSATWIKAMHVSLILYAEHEFNASTFTARVIAGTGSDIFSAITGGIGALRGPKHGGANEVALEIQQRYGSVDEAEKDIRARVENKEVILGFGHPVYTISDPRNRVIKAVAEELSREEGSMHLFEIAERIEIGNVGDKEDVPQFGLVLCRRVQQDTDSDLVLYPDFCDRPHFRMVGSRYRTAQRQQDHPSKCKLHRPRRSGLSAN
jgi:2-methylcitrate synthase